jgi:hypothetical protein
MLYKERPTLPQVRHYCRNSACAVWLKIPEANPRDAFCCRGCEGQYYARRCRVCENLFSPKTQRREVCGRSRCRHELQRHPEQYFGSQYPRAGCTPQNATLGQNASASAHSTGLKSGAKSGRGWRVIAGPADLHPINLQAFPADAAATRTGRPGSTLIGRTASPVNLVGGYKFPNAPRSASSKSRRPPPSIRRRAHEHVISESLQSELPPMRDGRKRDRVGDRL